MYGRAPASGVDACVPPVDAMALALSRAESERSVSGMLEQLYARTPERLPGLHTGEARGWRADRTADPIGAHKTPKSGWPYDATQAIAGEPDLDGMR